MVLESGTRLGPYEIVAPLGAGGMGDVYRARDTRLDRTVAIKVAKENFSERFEREARAIAALNHPHICQLYDVGPNYLVMEYVDGTPLTGPLPPDRALRFATQICDALDAAHRKGIVHRDLKPANVLVTRSGVKLLDFGIARVSATADNPTLTSVGEVMGTPAYMAPEQWDGKPADARSDIYAFGCVLYELLTGKRAAQERIPLPSSSLDTVVSACLAKDPDERWQSARDVRRALELPAPTPVQVRGPWRERIVWIVVVAAVAVAVFFAFRGSPVPLSREAIRLTILLPDNTSFVGSTLFSVPTPQFEISPDGRAVVFAAAAPGARPTLWTRALNSVAAQPLPGTDDADFPFWSPDSQSIGFFANGKLKKIAVTGGLVQQIADVPDPRPASWGPDGIIIFSTGTSGIRRISASGGTVTPVLELDTTHGEGQHRYAQFLPDGAHFLFSVRSSLPQYGGVYVGSLDGKTKKLLIKGSATLGGQTAARYSSGHVLFLDGDTLVAQAFDTQSLELKGQPFQVEGGVGRSSAGGGAYSLSENGTLVYTATGILTEPSRLTWFDREGTVSGSMGAIADWLDFRISPDQTRLAGAQANAKTGFPDIWLTDLTRGTSAPFTFGPAVNAGAAWSNDGTKIFFRSTRSGGLTEFFVKSAGGGGKEELVLSQSRLRELPGALSAGTFLWDVSPDDRYLLSSTVPSTDADLWVLSLDKEAKLAPFITAPGEQLHGNFSPDGRLVAYTSSESGRFEIKVQTFPLADRQWTVSIDGGHEPRWRSDGRELYYLSPDHRLMAVPVGPGPSFGAPTQLFQTRVTGAVNRNRTHYVPSRDGNRFLVTTPVGESPTMGMTVVLNATAGFTR
jgi:Tol biopolymer transport system component/predicted Ser/Thr protein kinase